MADKIIHSSVTNDYENGKLKRKEEEFTIKSQEPDYVKLYVKAWCAFKDIKGINMAFLTALLPYMSYATTGQKIYFNPALKDELCRQLGWSKKSGKTRVNVELDRLKKAGIIKRTAASTYAVNPELFGRGDWKDIKKLVVTFHLKDGQIEVKEEEPTLFDNYEETEEDKYYDKMYEEYLKQCEKDYEEMKRKEEAELEYMEEPEYDEDLQQLRMAN